ncbi:MAG: hypothetical protein IT308_06125 [Anaerolineaceae bacterium]|nr:hypothetical protein [Anaerolineaceae bacterium]
MVAAVPKGISPKIINRWFSMQELLDIGRRWTEKRAIHEASDAGHSPTIQIKEKEIPSPSKVHVDDKLENARKSAKELYALGNSLQQIRASLSHAKSLSAEEIQAILTEVEELEKKKIRKQRRQLMVILGIISLLLLCILACILIAPLIFNNQFIQNNSELNPAGSSGSPQASVAAQNNPVQPQQLPAPLMTFIPAGAKIVNPPTPQVQLAPPAIGQTGRCPRNPLEAAQLFGGSAETWQPADRNRGWLYVATDPVTITVPANMSAGYLVFDLSNMEMRSATGPAIIKNVYMITISCE